MAMPGKWEFPGGKIHDGETKEEGLARELREELGVETEVGEALAPVTHDYPTFRIALYPFWCTILSGVLHPHEHSELRWLKPEELSGLDWAEADMGVVVEVREKFQ